MSRAKRILFVSKAKEFDDKFLKGQRRLIKSFIRLGHDTHVFNYGGAFLQAGPILSRKFARKWCKSYVVDKLLVKQIKYYEPDIIHIGFPHYLDTDTIALMRQAAPDAFFMAWDTDPWPEYHMERVELCAKIDLLLTAFKGEWLKTYEKAGVRCIFMPRNCDPDIEYRHNVDDKWKSNILFTGNVKFGSRRYPVEEIRYQIVSKLAEMEGCALYGCFGRPRIGGIQYLYAISGARIGMSVNVVNDVPLYHSDRPTTYMACGTLVLAKRVPDSGLLFKDGVHLRYFDTAEEFFDLANYYLKHEDERIKIANAGMHLAHTVFNCANTARYILDIIEKGSYDAPWTK